MARCPSTRANVTQLERAWSFSLPETTTLRSQPVVTNDTVFVAATSGYLFALDRASGCTRWVQRSPMRFRTSVSLGTHPTSNKPMLLVGDVSPSIQARDAASGDLLWTAPIGVHKYSMATGSAIQFKDVIYVPVSSSEIAVAQNPKHECCTNHDAVSAISAADGKLLWTTPMTDEPKKTIVSSVGTQRWGPSGAPVWSTPAIDAKRRLIYVGTGENTSQPATDMSDSIVALEMTTGKIRWVVSGVLLRFLGRSNGNSRDCLRREP